MRSLVSACISKCKFNGIVNVGACSIQKALDNTIKLEPNLDSADGNLYSAVHGSTKSLMKLKFDRNSKRD